MTEATWFKGQNAPVPEHQFQVHVETAVATDLSAVLLDPSGRIRRSADLVAGELWEVPGITRHRSGVVARRIDVDLDGVPGEIPRILLVASVDGCPVDPGALSGTTARLSRLTGERLGVFPMTGLSVERAVIVFEFYRRAGQWRIRAVGQGYEEGLAGLVSAYGGSPPGPAAPAGPSVCDNAPGRPIRVPAGAAERPLPADHAEQWYNQIWAIFEDAARSAEALRSASDYADRRLERRLSDLVADPRTRHSPSTEEGRREAQRQHDELVAQAASAFQRDSSQLREELDQLAKVLPAPMAGWGDPSWNDWHLGTELTTAIRIGELSLPKHPELRLPFVFRLPLRQPIWIDSSGGHRDEATSLTRCIVSRLLAAHPRGALTVHVVDLSDDGITAQALAPLAASGSTLIAAPITSRDQLDSLLAELVARVEMCRMAAQAGVLDEVTARHHKRLLVLCGFPRGLEEEGLEIIRLLAENSAAAGISLLLVADPSEFRTGSVAHLITQSSTPLPAVQASCVRDPWIGQLWSYTPDFHGGGRVIDHVYSALAEA